MNDQPVPSVFLVDRAAGAAFFLHEDGEEGLYLAQLDDGDNPRWETIRPAFDPRMSDRERWVCDRAYRALLEFGGVARWPVPRGRLPRSA
jgi:hypothetical protein